MRHLLPVLPLLALAAVPPGTYTVDADFPGGNIVVDGIEGETVRLHQDLRDSDGDWFYWQFRVRGAAGRTLRFTFTRSNVIGVRGPAVSLDLGKSWRWMGSDAVRERSFTYKFERDGREVRFAMAMPYMESHWKDFLSRHKGIPYLETGVLTKSGKGRDVELAKVRKPGAEPEHRVLITSRHHACESMATYSLEGILEEALSGKEDGGWLREHVEILAIPFVDKDGVEDGDQGKNRRPRDHNRDYDGTSVHASVRAIRQLVPQWSGGKLHLALDMHCPHIRGETNEEIYFVGGQDAAMWARVERFADLLEKSQTGPLVFRSTNNIPFGKAWNTAANFAAGKSCSRWASELPGIRVATGIEIPYANAGGKAVTAETARALGADLARAIRQVLE